MRRFHQATVTIGEKTLLETREAAGGGAGVGRYAVAILPGEDTPTQGRPAHDTEAQAIARAEGGRKGKGGDAARACLAVLELKRSFWGHKA